MSYIPNNHQWHHRILIPGPAGLVYQEVRDLLEKSGRACHPEAVGAWLWRMGPHVTDQSQAIRDIPHLRQVLGLDPNPPTGTLAPVIVGDWAGHFLHARDFFQPGMASRSQQDRKAVFEWHKLAGYRHILINAEQADWGPSKGHPEWTHGGFNAYASDVHMHQLVDVCVEARSHGLVPFLGVVDQPSLTRSIGELIARTKMLVEATWEHTGGYMLSWEIREVWKDSTEREAKENRWIAEVDWHDRDVGIHYQAAMSTVDDHDPGLGGGVNRYRDLESIYPGHVVRMLQYHHSASDSVLIEQTRRTAGVVHKDHGLGKFMNFEHSSEKNQPKTYSTAGVVRRRNVIMKEVERIGLPKERTGFLN